ncbi:alpha/beta hydrolase [Planobispora siamensis]|uniref:Membrane protein n=1 Tax=Planobispora siamensis TaxID=936338 RepID=A0A8J3WHG8_9ACTN|nr:alpha/beta hydrolase [Planobispora siamensis]GIH90559.1 membrane protein [Planobispora siamensis]
MGDGIRGRLSPRLDTTGSVLATLFFCLSLTPSLLPRSWLLQGVIAGVLAATGYLVGVVAAALVRRLFHRSRSPVRRRLLRRVAVALGVVLCLVSVHFGAQAQREIYALMGMTPPERLGYLNVPLVAAAVFAVLLVLARLLRRVSLALARLLSLWISPAIARLAAAAGVAVLSVSLLNGILTETLLEGADASFKTLNGETSPGTSSPRAATLSGSPSSLVSWASLGLEGRDFVAGGPTEAELLGFSGLPPERPIRVYVGLDAASSVRERAALAVRELERTGAFDRRVLCVITTTGTGWVDPRPADALEFMYNGDTALVSIQYSYLPSWLSFLVDRERARVAGRELFNQVHDHWSRLPAGARPALLVFGESLGVFGGEAAFSGDDDLRNRTDGALFVGPPNSSALWGEFVRGRDPGTPEVLPVYRRGETVRFANRTEDMAAPSWPWPFPRVVYLQHPSDPIVWWSPDLVLGRPDWLREPRGEDVLPDIDWYPFVTFWQLTADMVFSLDAPAGHGHDYGGEVAAAWARIAPPSGWDDSRTRALVPIVESRTG